MCTILYVKKIVSFYPGTFKNLNHSVLLLFFKINYILPKTL